MNTRDLKNHLIERISRIDDINLLNALKTFLDTREHPSYINLSTKEQELLIAGEEGYKDNYALMELDIPEVNTSPTDDDIVMDFKFKKNFRIKSKIKSITKVAPKIILD